MIIRQDGDYWIVQSDQYTLMHRVWRPEIKSHSEMSVGEAFINADGFWEVRVAERQGQRMVRITDSPKIALEVLWEHRILMHWGYYQ